MSDCKQCTKCQEIKPIDHFYESKRNKTGRVTRCIICARNSGKDWYQKNKDKHKATGIEWKEKNKERHKQYITEYNRLNRDRIRVGRIEYKKENKEVIARKNREYYLRTKDKRREYERMYESQNKEERKAYLKTWRKDKMKNDIQYNIKHKLRSRLREALNTSGMRKSIKTMDLLGCTVLEFRAHIESLFYGNMSWKNMGLGKGKWQMDHKIAIGLFDLSNLDQQKQCFHWSNIQPLSHEDHLVKSKQDNELIREKKKYEKITS